MLSGAPGSGGVDGLQRGSAHAAVGSGHSANRQPPGHSPGGCTHHSTQEPSRSIGGVTSSTGSGSVHSHGTAAVITHSTVRMSAPLWHAPDSQLLPARAVTFGPSTSATRRRVRRCLELKVAASSSSPGQQL